MKRSISSLFLISLSLGFISIGCDRAGDAVAPKSAPPRPYAYVGSVGSTGTGPGLLSGPIGVAVDSAENVYVTDTGNDRVQKFDSNGNFLTQWGTTGATPGNFSSPYGIAVDGSGNVYVGDSGNNRIQKFTSGGSYLTQWGSSGAGNGKFFYPHGLAVDGSGNVYVADSGNSLIQKFDSNGRYLAQFGGSGSLNGEFDHPNWVTVGPQGTIYVSDTYNYRVQFFNYLMQYLGQFGTHGPACGCYCFCVTSGPDGLIVDLFGNIFVCDGGNGRVMGFTPAGTGSTEFGDNACGLPTNVTFGDNHGIAMGSSGKIYVADTNDDRVVVVSPH